MMMAAAAEGAIAVGGGESGWRKGRLGGDLD